MASEVLCYASVYFRYGAFLFVIIFNFLLALGWFKFKPPLELNRKYIFFPWLLISDLQGPKVIIFIGVVTFFIGEVLWAIFLIGVEPFHDFVLACDKGGVGMTPWRER